MLLGIPVKDFLTLFEAGRPTLNLSYTFGGSPPKGHFAPCLLALALPGKLISLVAAGVQSNFFSSQHRLKASSSPDPPGLQNQIRTAETSSLQTE